MTTHECFRLSLTPFKRIFKKQSEYSFSEKKVCDVDWISGMFMLFESSLFRNIGGFDVSGFFSLL